MTELYDTNTPFSNPTMAPTMQATLDQQQPATRAPFLPTTLPPTFTAKSRNYHAQAAHPTRFHRSNHRSRWQDASPMSTVESNPSTFGSDSAHLVTTMPPYAAPPGFYPPLSSTVAMQNPATPLIAPASCPPPPGYTIIGSWQPIPCPAVHPLSFQQPVGHHHHLSLAPGKGLQAASSMSERVTPTVYDPQLNENVAWRSEEREDGTGTEMIRVRPNTGYRPERWLPFVRTATPSTYT